MFGSIATPATASTRPHATAAASPPRWLHAEQSSLQPQSSPPRPFGSAAAKQSKSLDNAVLRFGSGGQINGRRSAKQHRSSKQTGQGVFSSDGSEHRQATASSSAMMTSRMSTNFDNFRLLCAAASEADRDVLQTLLTVSALVDRLQSYQMDCDARSKDDGLGAHSAFRSILVRGSKPALLSTQNLGKRNQRVMSTSTLCVRHYVTLSLIWCCVMLCLSSVAA